jgi:hypothetical protein
MLDQLAPRPLEPPPAHLSLLVLLVGPVHFPQISSRWVFQRDQGAGWVVGRWVEGGGEWGGAGWWPMNHAQTPCSHPYAHMHACFACCRGTTSTWWSWTFQVKTMPTQTFVKSLNCLQDPFDDHSSLSFPDLQPAFTSHPLGCSLLLGRSVHHTFSDCPPSTHAWAHRTLLSPKNTAQHPHALQVSTGMRSTWRHMMATC